MNHLYAKLAVVGTRSNAGIYALRDDEEEDFTEPMLTEDGASLILISTEFDDADGC